VNCSASDAAGNSASGSFTVTVTAPIVRITYVSHIQPILQNSNCSFCHSPAVGNTPYLTTYSEVRAEASHVVQETQVGGDMRQYLRATATETVADLAELIRRWVEEFGAPEN
jgi:hypothetical protein